MAYVFAVLSALLIIILILNNKKLKEVNVKNQQGRKERDRLLKLKKVLQLSTSVFVGLALLTGFLSLSENKTEVSNKKENETQPDLETSKETDSQTETPKESDSQTEKDVKVSFQHIHGLGYKNDGKEIYIPSHDGLRLFKDGKWSLPEGDKHDYMGFTMVDDGFYSSGHPAPGSTMKNPFGVLKSTDMGNTLETLDLYGEIDFHGMGVGYYSHAIYVINSGPNSRMDEAGVYYTVDNTKTWTKAAMNGVEGEPSTVAVHPEKENIVAIATDQGVYVSNDYGDNFENVANTFSTTVAFTKEGKLLAGIISEKPSLIEIDPTSKEQKTFSLPTLDKDDAISYMAENPQNAEEIVFTTFLKDIYITNDGGETWGQIAEKGTGFSLNADSNE
jgi:hypothetical protein